MAATAEFNGDCDLIKMLSKYFTWTMKKNLVDESAEIATRSHVNRITATEIRSCDTIKTGYFPEHRSLLTDINSPRHVKNKYNSNEFHN
jgi:hypothetical protein